MMSPRPAASSPPASNLVRFEDSRPLRELSGPAKDVGDPHHAHAGIEEERPPARAEVRLEDASPEEGRHSGGEPGVGRLCVEGLEEVRLVEAVHEAAEAESAAQVSPREAAQVSGI